MNLQEAIEKVAEETEGSDRFASLYDGSYSGRGMYGKNCPAIVGSWGQCQAFIAETIKHTMNELVENARELDDDMTDAEMAAHDAVVNEANELVDQLLDFCTDQMGRSDIVLYWPQEEYHIKQTIG